MSEPRHTPGPWEYVPEFDGDGEAAGVDHLVIADHGAVEMCCPATEADARLIAAAPDLLAACEAFVSRYDYLAGLWGEEGVSRGLADRVRAAIHKAVSY